MLCRTCQYPLWNLTARQCPECGAPFLPSEYEFKVGAVQFRCPHCAQSYYGTDERGHLVPPAFDCVTCGRAIAMDEMVVLPAEGVPDEQTRRRDPVPWLDRTKIGFFKGWGKTVLGGMGSPGKLALALPERSPVGQAWWFAAITLALSSMIGSLFPFMFIVLGPGPGLATFGGVLLVAGGGYLAWLLVWGVSAHVLLRVMGVSHARVGRTFEHLCYSCGPAAVVAIPCLGFYISWIGTVWWATSAAVALSVGYGVRWWKAALAVLVLPAVLMAAVMGLVFIGVSRVPAMMASARALSAAGAGPVRVTAALSAAGVTHPGPMTGHSAELVASGQIGIADLGVAPSLSTGATIRIGERTLDEFLALGPEEQAAAARAATAALPAGVVAHRLGDMVFTYHRLNAADVRHGMLWAVIAWPDPEANPAGPAGSVTVGLMNGTTLSVAAPAFAALLEEQNRIRAELKLPALPDPAVVTHGKPGVSP